MNAQLFLAYTGRYDKIMQSYPKNIRNARLDIDADLPDKCEELTQCVLRYLNLCSEEYYLKERGYLNNDIWKIWQSENEQ